MPFHRLLRRALCLLLCAALACTASAYAIADISEFSTRSQQLQQQQEELDKQLEQAREDATEQLRLQQALQAKINNVQEQIDLLNTTISTYNKEIVKKEAQIRAQQEEIDQDYEILGQRIRAIYMAGEASTLEIILGAKDFSDFIDKAYLIESISSFDAKIIDELSQKLHTITAEKTELEEEKAVVSQSKTELEKNYKELDALKQECDEVLSRLQETQDELEKQLQENSAEQQALSEELAQWHRQYVQESGGILGDGAGGANGYIWPAPECNVITSYWGDGRNHQGMDFACNGSAYGKPIIATQSGTVIRANSTDSWGSGWGYYVMIDHGGGYSTLYAHCSVLVVEPGQAVQQGEIIGYIGNTGNSYGAHLHFECWFNGQRYDPASELF